MFSSRIIYDREAYVESINKKLGEKYIATLKDTKIQLFEKEGFVISVYGRKVYLRKISQTDNTTHLVAVYTFKK